MKIKFAAFALCAVLLSAGSAQATYVDPLGLIATTKSGVVVPNDVPALYTNYEGKTPIYTSQYDQSYSGTLAAHTSITFSFSLASAPYISYSETLTGSGQSADYQYGTAVTKSGTGAGVSPYNSWGSSALVIATAGVLDSQHSYVTITNKSNMQSSFLARLQLQIGSLIFGQPVLTTTYSSVSSVPLPGSVLLFVSGLVALAGFAAWRKKAGM